VGIGSHIVSDAHNVTGVPLLWPLRFEFVSVYNRGLRVAYGSVNEFAYLASFSLLSLILVPLSIDGFSPWFHRALGAPYGAVEDYLLWRNDFEVFADIDGVNLVTNEDINSRYRVIDVLGKDELLVEDSLGVAYSAALEGSDLQVAKIRAWRGEKLKVSSYRLDVSGRLIRDLLYALPKGALNVFINSDLVLNQSLEEEAVLGRFNRISITGKRMLTRAARIEDLIPYANIVIKDGTAIVRAEYAVGFDRSQSNAVSGREGSLGGEEFESLAVVKTHVLQIPDLPSLSSLVIDVGDEVLEGQLLARYVDDVALELKEAEVAEAKQQLEDLEAERLREGEMYELKVKAIKQEIQDSTERLEKLRYLVERNAEPRNSLLSVQKALEAAEGDLIMEETRWTSQKLKFEQDVRELKLNINRVESQLKKELEDQWVRASVSGVVSDIKVTGVGVKGVDVEIVILESETHAMSAD
jgi:inner membrane protein